MKDKRKYPKRIPVSDATYRELLKRGRFHETWDDVIQRLLYHNTLLVREKTKK